MGIAASPDWQLICPCHALVLLMETRAAVAWPEAVHMCREEAGMCRAYGTALTSGHLPYSTNHLHLWMETQCDKGCWYHCMLSVNSWMLYCYSIQQFTDSIQSYQHFLSLAVKHAGDQHCRDWASSSLVMDTQARATVH